MFITFEGIDGCGKTTQLNLLKDYLINKDFEVVVVREPGGTDLSEKIRNILLDISNAISPMTELLLFEAARNHLVSSVIKPALDKNCIVLSDRFFDSTVAYQGFGRGLEIEQINFLNLLATNNLVPDITFYLDVPLETALERRFSNKQDRIEASGNEFYKKVINGYKQLASMNKKRVFAINAAKTTEQTMKEIIEIIENYLDKIQIK